MYVSTARSFFLAVTLWLRRSYCLYSLAPKIPHNRLLGQIGSNGRNELRVFHVVDTLNLAALGQEKASRTSLRYRRASDSHGARDAGVQIKLVELCQLCNAQLFYTAEAVS